MRSHSLFPPLFDLSTPPDPLWGMSVTPLTARQREEIAHEMRRVGRYSRPGPLYNRSLPHCLLSLQSLLVSRSFPLDNSEIQEGERGWMGRIDWSELTTWVVVRSLFFLTSNDSVRNIHEFLPATWFNRDSRILCQNKNECPWPLFCPLYSFSIVSTRKHEVDTKTNTQFAIVVITCARMNVIRYSTLFSSMKRN